MRLRVTVLDPALDPQAPMWGDSSDGWLAPAHAWVATLAAAGVPLRAIADARDDDGEGLLVLPSGGDSAPGRPVITGPPPDAPVEAVVDVLGALVRPDLRGVLVLRLDDPGASVRAHLDWWRHDAVSHAAWDALWSALDGFGRVSLFCCPAWVEADGRVVDSRERNPQEWAALDAAVGRGIADLECHGHTHLHPNLERWAAAPDRTSEVGWYRELWSPLDAREPATSDQAAIIERWQQACGTGTTLVAPGEGWGAQTLAAARLRGLKLFTSWGVCRLDLPAPAWSRGITSPYLDEVDAARFDGGLPVVGYWHDRDMAVNGERWAPDLLAAWREAGARRAWAFADLAKAYEPIDAVLEGGEVRVLRAPDGVPLLTELRR